MSTTKPLLVKAEQPQDQTFASSLQAVIDHTLADQTTELSKAIDDAVVDSVFYGSSMLQISPNSVTAIPHNIWTSTAIGTASANQIRQSVNRWPEVQTNMIEIKEHEAFNTSIATLLDLWVTRFGNEWVDLEDIENDAFFAIAYKRLKQMGELEQHYLTDRARYVCRKPE